MAIKHLIILVHGIRDPGFWQNSLRDMFEGEGDNIHVATIRTDVIDVFKFLSPITIFRRQFVNDVEKSITNLVFDENYRDHQVTIIAHSFGTYIVTNILHENTDIEIDKLILCGGIVPNNFRWDRIRKINFRSLPKNSRHQENIINEYSPRDIWPLLAKTCAIGYGNGGSKGCGDPCVYDRSHFIPHSGYLVKSFAEKFWKPFIFQNKIVSDPEGDLEGRKLPGYFILTRIPINLMAVVLFAAAIYTLSIVYYKIIYIGGIRSAIFYSAVESPDLRIPRISFSGHRDALPTPNRKAIYIQPEKKEEDRDRYFMQARSLEPLDELRIKISNRPPHANCVDEEDIEGELAEDANEAKRKDWSKEKTTYVIRYRPKNMHANIWQRNWGGQVDFRFEYNPNPAGSAGTNTDFLKILPLAGIDTRSLDVDVWTDSASECDQAQEFSKVMYTVVTNESSGAGWLPNWIRTAFAGDIFKSIKDKSILNIGKHLESTDKRTRSIGIEQLKQSPSQYEEIQNPIFDRIADFSEDQLIDILGAIPDLEYRGQAGISDVSLDKVFQLTWDTRKKVRAAARRLFRHPKMANLALANRLKTLYRKHKQTSMLSMMISEKYTSGYLARIAIRDVYYNAAIDRFHNSRELSGGEEAIDVANTASTEIFEAGRWLIDDSPAKEKPAMAKNLYGKALINLRTVFVVESTKGRQSKLSWKQIAQILADAASKNVVLSGEQTGQLKQNFSEFLQIAAVEGAYYPWKNHISQANKCTSSEQGIPYNCVN